jgi:hypothetical protein
MGNKTNCIKLPKKTFRLNGNFKEIPLLNGIEMREIMLKNNSVIALLPEVFTH